MEQHAPFARRQDRRRPAFTLIELLVVVAIIALLISILLPSLSQAKEKAKTVKCIANLKSIGDAMNMYFIEHNEWFPYEKSSEYGGVHGFYYGGHPGRVDPYKPLQWWGYVDEDWRDTPGGRPFNDYLYPGLPKYNLRPRQPKYQAVRDLPTFQCPSDTGSFWTSQTDSEENSPLPTHWTTGNSYTENYLFAVDWAIPRTRPNGDWIRLANRFLAAQREHNASTFIVAYEDPFDSAIGNNIPRRGWHKQWMRHSFLFLDGHAAHIFADSTKGNSGVGWKTATGEWWDDPDDPDYIYKDMRPR